VTSGFVVSKKSEEQRLIERTVDDLTPKTEQERKLDQVQELIRERIEQMLGAKNTPTLRARIRREAIEIAEDLIGPEMAKEIDVQVDQNDPTHVKISIPFPSVPFRGFNDSDG